MKKTLFGSILLAVITVFPVISMARVDVRILPPPIVFAAPPNVVILPGTGVYAVPDVEAEIFFRQGWWWRHWDNRWYRSRYYDHGWGYYRGYPAWHRRIPHNWRDNYRNHRWHGRPWNYHPIHHGDLNRHWRGGHGRDDHGREHPGGHGGGPGGHRGDRGGHGVTVGHGDREDMVIVVDTVGMVIETEDN